MTEFENLIIGSTFFAVGFALRNKNSLIIDKASRLGYEYTDSFDNSFYKAEVFSKPAMDLLNEFEEREIISDTHKPVIAAYPSVLSKIVIDNNLNILFRTVIVGVEKDASYYYVKLFNANGLKTVKCKNIIDTTSRNFSKKSLNAVVLANKASETENESFELVSGENDNVMYLKYFVANDDDFQTARKELYTFLRNELKDVKLAQTAYEFEYYYDKINITSSDYYKNPVKSFDAGFNYNENEEFCFDEEIVEEEYDVVVCGLGTAGSVCLVNSAENNLKTLGLETEAMIGGTQTAGQVLGYYYGAEGGKFEEIDAKVYKNKVFAPANTIFPERILPDAKVEVLENEAEIYGADLKYKAYVYDVIKKDNRVVGLKYLYNNKLYVVKCKYVVDATGEADICYLAGADTLRGRKSDAKVQPFSICTLKMNSDNVESYYCDNGYINPNSVEEYTNTLLNTYVQKMFLKEKYDNRSYFSVIAPMPGMREGRYIKAIRNISFNNYLNGFEDVKPLFYAYSNMDTHGSEHAFESDIYIEWAVVSRLRKKVFAVPVSIENLIPSGVEGIIAAGRCIGVEHDISPCVRMKKDMQKCGEAVAELLAFAVKDNISPLEVDYKKIKNKLEKSGCLDENNNKSEFCIGKLQDGTKICVDIDFYKDVDSIYNNLRNVKTAPIAIISAVKLNIVQELRKWLSEEDIALDVAYASAMLGDKSALPVIRKRIKEHPLMDTSSSRDDLLCDMAAIYLSAKLQDKESIEDIINIFEISKDNYMRNQYLFFSIHAIKKFYLAKFISKERYISLTDSINNIKICLSEKEDIYEDITEQIKNYMREVL